MLYKYWVVHNKNYFLRRRHYCLTTGKSRRRNVRLWGKILTILLRKSLNAISLQCPLPCSRQDHYYAGCYSRVEILPVAGSIIFKRVPPLRHLLQHSRHYFFRILQPRQMAGIIEVIFLLIRRTKDNVHISYFFKYYTPHTHQIVHYII